MSKAVHEHYVTGGKSLRHLKIAHRPFRVQRRFHSSNKKIKLFRGGAGSGKTTAGAAEALRLAIENPRLDGFIVSPTYNLLHRVTLREFRRLVTLTERRTGEAIIAYERKGERFIELVNGARIYYGSADRPQSLEGSTVAWIWGDEARYFPVETWRILNARCREPRAARRCIVLTTTPAMNWLYEEFVIKATADHDDIHCSALDNPYLPEDYVDRLRASFSTTFFEQYVLGEWRALEGVVYPQYDPVKNHRWWDIDPTMPIHIGVDFGINNPAAVFAQAHGDRLYIVGEYTPKDITTPEFVLGISRWLRENGCKPGRVFCDPAGRARNEHSGMRNVELLEMEGFDVDFARDPVLRSVRYGIDVVRSRFLNFAGERNLFITKDFAEACQDNPRGIIAMLRAYQFRKGTEDPLKDEIVDHIADALRYLCVGLYGESSAGLIETAFQYQERQKGRVKQWL